jgi:hypothetical protein
LKLFLGKKLQGTKGEIGGLSFITGYGIFNEPDQLIQYDATRSMIPRYFKEISKFRKDRLLIMSQQ